MRNIYHTPNRITVTASGVHVSGFDTIFGRQRKLNLSKIPETVYIACGLNAYNSRIR